MPFIASFGSFLDETSALADVILPDHTFLESWSDAWPESGASVAVLSLAPPAMQPLHDTRATPDVLLTVGKRLRRQLDLPWESFDQMLRATYEALPVLADVLESLQKRFGDSDWSIASWFTSPNPHLPGKARPVDRLPTDAEAVTVAARRGTRRLAS